eukprot:CFRG1412T1
MFERDNRKEDMQNVTIHEVSKQKVSKQNSKNTNVSLVVNNSSRSGRCDVSKRLQGSVSARQMNNAIMYFMRGRKYEKVSVLCQKALNMGLALTPTTYKYIMAERIRHCRWNEAIDMFNEMQSRGVPLNTSHYDLKMVALVKNGLWKEGMAFLHEMQVANVPRTTIIYHTLAMGCLEAHEWMHSVSVLQMAIDDKIKFDMRDCRYLIQMSGRQGETCVTDCLYHFMARMHLRTTWSMVEQDGLLDLHNHSRYMAEAAVRRILRILVERRQGIVKKSRWKLVIEPVNEREKWCVRKNHPHPFVGFVVGNGSRDRTAMYSLRSVIKEYLLVEIVPPIRLLSQTKLVKMNEGDLNVWLARQV